MMFFSFPALNKWFSQNRYLCLVWNNDTKNKASMDFSSFKKHSVY